MTKRNEGGSGLIKTVIIGAIGTIASYYAAAWAKKMLEEKPLKTRVREGKAKMMDIKDTALQKAQSLKSMAKSKVGAAAEKANGLIQEKADQAEDALKKDNE